MEQRGSSGISVVMTTFNGARYVAPQIDSLLAQTLPPLEILIGDDGSTDETLTIVESYASRSPIPIRVLRNEKRLGFADNFFSTGLRSRGELIAWCDQDDVWHSKKLELCRAAFRDPATMLVVHGALRFRDNVSEVGRVRTPLRRRFRRLSASPWLVPEGFRQVFRRQLLDVHDPWSWPGRWGPRAHDEWTYAVAHAAGDVRWLAVPLVRRRLHDSNLTGAPPQPSALATLSTHSSTFDHKAAEAAERRADYFDLLSERLPHLPHLAEAARWYRSHAASLRRRGDLYNAGARRASELVRMVARGVYRPRRAGGLGFTSLVKDAALAGVTIAQGLIGIAARDENGSL